MILNYQGMGWTSVPLKFFIWFGFICNLIAIVKIGKEKANKLYPSYIKEDLYTEGIKKEVNWTFDVLFLIGIMILGWGWSFVIVSLTYVFKYAGHDMQKKYAYEYLKEKESGEQRNVEGSQKGNGKGSRVDRRA